MRTEGDNHEQFFDASASPAYHIVMTEVGHMDMLDRCITNCMTCSACVAGTDQAGARQMTWGALTAFFRGALQGEIAAFDILGSDVRAPTVVILDQK